MGQLKANLVPTWANLGQLGQLGANMDVAKPEKLAFRLDGNTIFTKLRVSLWERLGRRRGRLGRPGGRLGEPFGEPWGRLGRPWGTPGGAMGDAKKSPGKA